MRTVDQHLGKSFTHDGGVKMKALVINCSPVRNGANVDPRKKEIIEFCEEI